MDQPGASRLAGRDRGQANATHGVRCAAGPYGQNGPSRAESQGARSGLGRLDSLELGQCVQILDLLDLVVVEVQLPEAVQRLQVLDALDQVLTQAESLGRKGRLTWAARGATSKQRLYGAWQSHGAGRAVFAPVVLLERGDFGEDGRGHGGSDLLGERGLAQGLGCVQFPSRVNPLVGSIQKMNLTAWPRAARCGVCSTQVGSGLGPGGAGGSGLPDLALCPAPCPALLRFRVLRALPDEARSPAVDSPTRVGGRSEDGAESSHLHFLQNLEPLNFPDAVVIQIDILK